MSLELFDSVGDMMVGFEVRTCEACGFTLAVAGMDEGIQVYVCYRCRKETKFDKDGDEVTVEEIEE